MKIATILGARPQFIKAAPVSRALDRAGHTEFMIHTGQHYDYGMSQLFFEELGLPQPDVNLGVGSGTHGRQTGQMLMEIEAHLLAQEPDWVLVYGDTNSTLAGALAAVKLHMPVAHVEAGLRSYNRTMPEEHNRVLTDHCADLLFCPTATAVANLAQEGITDGVHQVGDVMYDAVRQFSAAAEEQSRILEELSLVPHQYLLATIHRPYNTDDPERLQAIFAALARLEEPVILPLHPRTDKMLNVTGIKPAANVCLLEPVGYLDMLALEHKARIILTDSGGVQKEAYFMGVPCITLRPETEWVETVAAGWNLLVDNEIERIVSAVNERQWPQEQPPPVFGDGHAAEEITWLLETPQSK
jgi:UDP-GlcNAc3NAcA epimerase